VTQKCIGLPHHAKRPAQTSRCPPPRKPRPVPAPRGCAHRVPGSHGPDTRLGPHG